MTRPLLSSSWEVSCGAHLGRTYLKHGNAHLQSTEVGLSLKDVRKSSRKGRASLKGFLAQRVQSLKTFLPKEANKKRRVGIATRSKDATRGSWPYYSEQEATRGFCHCY